MVRTPLIPTRPSESRETSHVTVVWTVALTPGRVRKPLASVLMERLTQLSPFAARSDVAASVALVVAWDIVRAREADRDASAAACSTFWCAMVTMPPTMMTPMRSRMNGVSMTSSRVSAPRVVGVYSFA